MASQGQAAAVREVRTNDLTEVVPVDIAQLRSGEASTSGRASTHPGISRAAAVLEASNIVAIPTETVYGLAANALSSSAVGKIYAAKNRPADNPLIIHVSSLDMLASLYPPGWALPRIYEAVIRDLWPGPLTILLPRSPLVPDAVTCGLPTMAVRMPAHPVALALITTCGFPLAAPSANSSGRPSPTLACHVLSDLSGRVPLILDGGACTCGVESTVLDGLRNPPAVLRPGGITREQLALYPGLEGLLVYHWDFVDAKLEAAPTTPGMKYRHYSPTAPVLLLDPGNPTAAAMSDEELAERLRYGTAALLAELGAVVPGAAGDPGAVAVSASAAAAVAEAGPARGVGQRGLRQMEDSNGEKQERQHFQKQLDDCRQQQQDVQGHQNGQANLGPGTGLRSPEQGPVGVLRTSLRGLPPGPLRTQPPDVPASTAAPVKAFTADDNLYGEQHPQVYEYVLGHVSQPAAVASELFAALRHLDEVGAAVIVVEGVRDSGAGVAVMNRLRKAASRVLPVGRN